MPYPFTAIRGIQTTSTNGSPLYNFIWTETTLKWYSTAGNPSYWMNGSKQKYYYVAIG